MTVLDYGEQDGVPFLAMEYVEGESLASRIKRSGRLAQADALSIIAQVLNALVFAHENGVIHRDIKPSNILLTAADAVKVADFGIAHVEASDLTVDGDILGTPSYMAPEQFSGAAVDHRADLFAAGVVLFEMLTGAKPFQGPAMAQAMASVPPRGPADARALNPQISPALRQVLDKALSIDRERRYNSAREFATAITEAVVSPGRSPDSQESDETALLPVPAPPDPAGGGQPRNAQNVVRRLAAILAADVVGYSRLMAVDEEGTLERLKLVRRLAIDPKIEQHRGRIVKTTGDGLLVEFASAVDAVRCAVEVQDIIAERNAGTAADTRIEFRIGINIGDVILDDGDLYGDGVNVAARLEALAEPGGVLVSSTVRDHVVDRLDCEFEDRGSQQVKNIPRPIHVFRVRLRPKPGELAAGMPIHDKPSLVVLPFQNISADPAQEHTADGIVEEITTALSRLPWLDVTARSSSFRYKGKAVDVRQVARELGVRYGLEGSVRKSGRRLRVTAQLIDTATGSHLWADRFDGAVENAFKFQDQVASAVAGAVEKRLRPAPTDGSAAAADAVATAPFSEANAAQFSSPDRDSSGIAQVVRKPLLTKFRLLAGAAGLSLAAAAGLAALLLPPGLFQQAPPGATRDAAQTARPTAEPNAAARVAPATAAAPGAAGDGFDPEKVPLGNKDVARRYLAGANQKALAISPSGRHSYSFYSQSVAREAQRRALEACEFYAQEACFLYATNNEVEPAAGDRPAVRPALGPGEGRFIPAEVPFVSDSARRSFSSYASAAGAKALAVSPNGNYGTARQAATAEEAQRDALERCAEAEKNSSSAVKRTCYLYAIDDTVVLAKRAATPIAAEPAVGKPPVPSAAPEPAASPPAKAREAFDPEKVPYVKNRDDVRRYGAYPNTKALAISTTGVSWWMSTERQALEACEFSARQPCILYAVGNFLVSGPDGLPAPRPTLGPGVGRFAPAEVPFVSYATQQLLSVYATAANAKAFAVSPRGNFGLAGDVATTEEAQRLALERCQNAENAAFPSSRRPCYVYAIGETVVLAKRAIAPISGDR